MPLYLLSGGVLWWAPEPPEEGATFVKEDADVTEPEIVENLAGAREDSLFDVE